MELNASNENSKKNIESKEEIPSDRRENIVDQQCRTIKRNKYLESIVKISTSNLGLLNFYQELIEYATYIKKELLKRGTEGDKLDELPDDFTEPLKIPVYLIELRDEVWLARWNGDPGRTIKKEKAKKFFEKRNAYLKLGKLKKVYSDRFDNIAIKQIYLQECLELWQRRMKSHFKLDLKYNSNR